MMSLAAYKLRPLLLFILIFTWVGLLCAEEFTFEEAEIEKKPYSIGGFLEFRPVLFGLDRDSAFYHLKYFDQDQDSLQDEYNFGLRLEGGYEKGIASAFFRTDAILGYSDEGWDDDFKLLEGYLALKPAAGVFIGAGKRVVPWGKGYAFNPTAFVSRPKDIDNPTEALEGYYLIDADFIRSFHGPLKTLAFTPVVLPVAGSVNDDFGEADDINFAAKLYLLLWDTDFDLMFFTGGSRTTRYGFDFARNILPNLEIHGEAAWITDFEKKSIDSQGRLFTEPADVLQALLGVRYLTETDITYIVEYYHNGGGIDTDSEQNFYGLVDSAYNHYLNTGDSSQLARASQLSRSTLASVKPMRDYLYFRASIKEPFEILYLTPALTAIMNLNDRSLSLTPEFIYAPISNLELRLRNAFLIGTSDTEFGEKQNDWRAELRVRYFF